VATRQFGDTVEHVRVATALGRGGELEEPIGHAAHRRHDDHRRQPRTIARRLDDGDHAHDRIRIRHRRATEFHDDGPRQRHVGRS
jgi:hypothetical protein